MIFIVCGVSGTGKTTVGMQLAESLEVPFYDADDFHPASNVAKMSTGIPLDDQDRQPWLETLADQLDDWQQAGGAVLACSALKESYRATLGSKINGHIHWIVLVGSEALLTERLAARAGHFFDRNLLRSQLDDFEIPGYGWTFDVSRTPEQIVSGILERLDST